MKFRVHRLWKVLVPSSNGAHFAHRPSQFYNEKGGKSFVRTLGGDFRLDVAPVVLSPTDLFHDALSSTRQQLNLQGNRFPYSFESIRLQGRGSVNISMHRHDGVLCATVRPTPFDVGSVVDWADLQDLRGDEVLWPLVRKALAIVVTGSRTTQLPGEPQFLPAIHIESLEDDMPDWQSQLVSLVTRHASVNDRIVRDVLRKNKIHQVDDSQLLIDKQGVAAYVPRNLARSAADANLHRFEHSASMLQLAAVTRRQLNMGVDLPEDLKSAILDPSRAITGSVSGRHIWSLFVNEFSLAKLSSNPMGSIPGQELERSAASAVFANKLDGESTKSPYRVLLLTVTLTESKALQRALIDATGRRPKPVKIDGFSYRRFERFGDYEIFHQISGMGSGGIDGSQESVRRSLSAVAPSAVLMIGIAFGVDPSKQPIGTILISKQIQMYELQRINSDHSITLRGDKVTASPMLLNWVSHAEVDWGGSSPKIDKGLLLSGEKLIDDEDYRKGIVQVAPESRGGEMEGAGLYVACHGAKVEWLIIKAVCDWADGNKSTEKEQRQVMAAKAAAEFLIHLLRSNSERSTDPEGNR